MTSPAVWAGPTSINCTSTPPISRSRRPSNVRLGYVASNSDQSNGAKISRANAPTAPGAGAQARDALRSVARHLGEGGRRGDDLGVLDELVPEPVIAVGVGVHDGGDRSTGGHRPHTVEHGAGERHVEQGVDEQRSAVADDESGVAPPPAAIGLEPRVATVTELVETLAVAGIRHGRTSSPLSVLGVPSGPRERLFRAVGWPTPTAPLPARRRSVVPAECAVEQQKVPIMSPAPTRFADLGVPSDLCACLDAGDQRTLPDPVRRHPRRPCRA